MSEPTGRIGRNLTKKTSRWAFALKSPQGSMRPMLTVGNSPLWVAGHFPGSASMESVAC